MLADRAHQLGPGQTARLDRFLNVSDFLRSELAPGQKFRCSISDQLAAAPDRPPYHLKTVFACPLLFRDKIILHSGLSCSDLSGKQTMRQRWQGAIRTRVVLLGTGTPVPDPDRSGPATVITADDRAYLVDFGPGVIRRAEAA